MIVICNFTPQLHIGYRIGVQEAGQYQEVFSSDRAEYGGSGITNGLVESEEVFWHRRDKSILIDVAPLGMSVLKWNKTK